MLLLLVLCARGAAPLQLSLFSELANVTDDRLERLVNGELLRRARLPDDLRLPATPASVRTRPRSVESPAPPLPPARPAPALRTYHKPNAALLVPRMHHLMRQSIYETRERMQALRASLLKHKNSLRFRMGFVFSRLADLEYDLHMLYSYMRYRAITGRDYFKVENMIYYYQHAFSKYVDAVYMVERVIKLFTQYKRAMVSLLRGPGPGPAVINATTPAGTRPPPPPPAGPPPPDAPSAG